MGHGCQQCLPGARCTRDTHRVTIQHPDWHPAIETPEILSDPEAMAELIEAEGDIAAGHTVDLSEIRKRPGFGPFKHRESR